MDVYPIDIRSMKKPNTVWRNPCQDLERVKVNRKGQRRMSQVWCFLPKQNPPPSQHAHDAVNMHVKRFPALQRTSAKYSTLHILLSFTVCGLSSCSFKWGGADLYFEQGSTKRGTIRAGMSLKPWLYMSRMKQHVSRTADLCLYLWMHMWVWPSLHQNYS